MLNGYRLHHIGVAVPAIEAAARSYVERFGYVLRTGAIHDPVQTAYVQFLERPGETALIELVAPDGPASKLANAVGHGGGLNHLCYAVDDIEEACRLLSKQSMAVVHAPVPAVAFANRRIAWLIGRDRVLIELVERGPEGSL